jgi:acyl dehydratase
MAQTVLDGVDEVKAAVGRDLGTSGWLEITQDRVDLFAEATGDHQWIHVDPDRAAAGPFGGTIAHGYLTLSLSNAFLPEIVEVRGFSMGVNYGAGKVRFPAPVRVGSRIRGSAVLVAVDDVAGGVQTTIVVTIEIEGETKPACVVEAISRYLIG